MIVDFSVQNFKSIKDLQTLSMAAAPIVSKYKEVDDQNVIQINSKISLLKSKAIYGANASGKSNMLKALKAFISIVTDSVKEDEILFKKIYNFELSTETVNKPTYFQLTFYLNDIFFRYGFETTKNEITSEWLFGTPGKKEVPFFTREERNINVNERQFKEGQKLTSLYGDKGNEIARNNSLFLTAVKSFSSGLAKEIVDYISEITIVSGLEDVGLHTQAEHSLSNEEKRKDIVELIKVSDTGIFDIIKYDYKSKDNIDRTAALTSHKKFNANLKEVGKAEFFMFIDESEGTKKMFEIAPLILETLQKNKILIIDEFDARFHPLLSRKILELFNSKKNLKAQFVFATHDTNLLNAKFLRRDQICFSEKDKYGASHFYTLVDFKGVRNDSSFEKDYIEGRFGAIPFLGDFQAVIEG